MLLMEFVGCETIFRNQCELTIVVAKDYLVSFINLDGFLFIHHVGYLKF